jgi:hypothetical protein
MVTRNRFSGHRGAAKPLEIGGFSRSQWPLAISSVGSYLGPLLASFFLISSNNKTGEIVDV